MKKFIIVCSTTALLTIALITNSYSQWGPITDRFKKVGSAVKTAGKATIKFSTAPYKTMYNTGKVVTGHGSLRTIYRPYTDISKTIGAGVPNAVDLLNTPNTVIYNQGMKLSRNLGSPGKIIYDISTVGNQLSNQLGVGVTNSVGNTLSGQNPLQIISSPLAAAIREARQRHISEARPLPANIKAALKGYFPEAILDRAKYCVGNIEITLPSFIEFFFDQDGVAVDDVIVFRSTPSPYVDWLWVHELTHLQQYQRMGIESFAYNYMKDHNALEKEANAKANSFIY